MGIQKLEHENTKSSSENEVLTLLNDSAEGEVEVRSEGGKGHEELNA